MGVEINDSVKAEETVIAETVLETPVEQPRPKRKAKAKKTS